MRICPHCEEIYPDDSQFCAFDGTELKKVEDPWIGKTLGNKYQIMDKIGEGGMGSIYRAVQFHPERRVAIKILPKNSLNDPTLRQRFDREGMAVAMLQHEHIVAVYDAGETADGIPYLVMEYLPGASLAQILRGGPLDAGRTAQILIQACKALGPIHAMDIIHRDLKPGNIFLLKRPPIRDFVKILDFGIAFLMDKPRLTDKGLILGTPEYMAPEQVFGKNFGPPLDLYSLGCIAYEMLCGEAPFKDNIPANILLKQAHEKPVPIHEKAAGVKVPLELDRVIMRLLEKDPGDRYADAYALLNDLQAMEVIRTTEPEKSDLAAAPDKKPHSEYELIRDKDSVKWKKFVSTTKDKSSEMKEALAIVNEMEAFTAKLDKIEDEQAVLSREMEKIELSDSAVKARLRFALEELAKELSGTRSAASSLVSVENKQQKADTGGAIKDLEYQVQEVRVSLQSMDSESAQRKYGVENRLSALETEKQQIKTRLTKLSVIVGKDVGP